jgi:hypothetical protein
MTFAITKLSSSALSTATQAIGAATVDAARFVRRLVLRELGGPMTRYSARPKSLPCLRPRSTEPS